MLKFFLLSLLISFFILTALFGQDITVIKVNFLYGSKPDRHYKNKEIKYFGGLHGGHVSIGIDTTVVGFGRYNGFHIFSHKHNMKGIFKIESINCFMQDTVYCKYTTFQIALKDSQYYKLKTVINNYLYTKTPYDYAFFGMRCASAAYDILSQIGIFEIKSRWGNILSNFYPKLLRKKMFTLSEQNNYIVTKQPGRISRKWEND